MRAAGYAMTALALLAGAAPAATAQPAPAEYVSLGDSYAAIGSVDRLTWRTSSCLQGTDNVGHLIAARLPGTTLVDRACAGATTDDVLQPTGRGRQVDSLSPATRYVTVSIGGNDGDAFETLATRCMFTPACTQDAHAVVDRARRETPDRLRTTYRAIRAAAPNARVVVLGYPRGLPDRIEGCPLLAAIDPDQLDFTAHAWQEMNDTIAAVAAETGFTMVAEKSPDGHDMCAPDGARYISATGVGPGDDGTPVHPTRAGREYLAELATAALTGS